MPPTYISSNQNPRVKAVKSLFQKRQRDRVGQFLLEGERELQRGLASGLEAKQILLCPEWFKHGRQSEALHEGLLNGKVPLVYLSKPVFENCSYRDNPDGFMAVCETFHRTTSGLKFSENPLVLVLESLEKPGNLGTILRSADATGVDALILNDPVTDIFNPNVIRASAGVVFQVPAVVATPEETVAFLSARNIASYATTPLAECLHFDALFSGPTAILMGSEKAGLSDFWLKHCHQKIRLPMRGQADSLNVGAATAAILYEVLRQRR